MKELWHIGSDQILFTRDELGNGLVNTASGAYVNNASSAVVAMTDNLGASFSGPYTMSYVAASNGVYSCTIPASDTGRMTAGKKYTATATITYGSLTLVQTFTRFAEIETA